MNQTLKNMLFDYTDKVVVEDGVLPEGTNLNYVLSINKNLNNLGYSLDMKTMRRLSANDMEQIRDFYVSLMESVKNKLGVDEFISTPLFYANFPEEVMEKSEMELYFNALIYYSFAQTDDPDMTAIADRLHDEMTEKKAERLPLASDMPENPKIITGTDEHAIDRLIDGMIHGLALNEQGFTDAFTFAGYEPERFEKLISSDKPFGSKAILVRLAEYFYGLGNTGYVSALLKDSMDVVRFAAMLSNKNDERLANDADLMTMPKFNLKKAQETYIKNLLAKCPNLEHDMWASKKSQTIFKRLSKNIHPKHGDPVVVKAFDDLIKGNKPGQSLTARIEAINNTEDNGKYALSLTLFVDQFSGVFLRNIVSIAEDAERKGRTGSVINAVKSVHDVPVAMLLKVRDLVEKRDTFGLRSFRLKNGRTFSTENRPLALSETSKDGLVKALTEAARNEGLTYHDSSELVYIDPALKDIKIPERSMRNANGRATLAPYSVIRGNKDKNLVILGIYWKNNRHRIDLDLAAVAFSEDFMKSANIAYYDLRQTFGLHSGDYTTAPDGATEAILIDKDECRRAGYRYVFANVYSYSGDNLCDVPDARFVSQERSGHIADMKKAEPVRNRHLSRQDYAFIQDGRGSILIDGEVFEPSCFERNVSLTASALQEIVFVYDVAGDAVIWLDKANKNLVGIINAQNRNARIAMLNEVAYMNNNAIPSLYEAFEVTAENLTDNSKEADRLYLAEPIDVEKEGLKDGATVVTAMELSKIMDEYLDKPKAPVEQTAPIEKDTKESDVNVLLRLIRETH